MTQPTMTPLEIRGALLSAGHTMASVADRLGVNKSTVHGVVHGRVVSARVQGAIAALIGRDPWAKAGNESAA